MENEIEMTSVEERPRITVLHSLGKPDGTTRYVDHMIDSAPESLQVETLSWKRALTGRYDVFHIHWPENLIRGKNRVSGAVKKTMFVTLLGRLRLSRRPIVRTVHNVAPHEEGSVVERSLLKLCDRATTHFIRLNVTTELPEGKDSSTILHGHYRDRPEYQCSIESDPTRLLYFGLIRPYKGIEDLLPAFSALRSETLTLRIVGKPQDEKLAADILAACDQSASVTCKLAFVPDAELAAEIASASLVVLPYREMHNSGAAILALSMDRPVLVPATQANRALQEEVGEDWVHLYEGSAITAEAISDAVDRAASRVRTARPDLSERDWDRIGERHYQLYASLLATAAPSRTRETA
ncbi:glycosyltransferase [Prescottella soli]|uniref:Glycosyltransferase n=1 Tax=Prescottella soli TaxID=1543852 RepID=A0ABW9FYK2_9NOCA